MAKKGEKITKVLVGTYRPENANWIKSQKLYNLPLNTEQDLSVVDGFSKLVLYSGSLPGIAYKINGCTLTDKQGLKDKGYQCASKSHGKFYALLDLGGKISVESTLKDKNAEVYVQTSRWTGLINDDFYNHPMPVVEGESVQNIFNKLKPFYKKCKKVVAFTIKQMSLLDEIANYSFKDTVPFPGPKNPKFTFIDLFAGIGGFHLAMDKLGGKCLFACEWDKDAQNTYEENYGIRPAGDITKINEADIPKHDVLCAGFPCQAFSKAGKQLGFADETKGTLFFDVERILKYHKSKYIVLENVRNLVAHDNGNTWKTIHSHLVELGYRLTPEPLIVSPHYFGVPQLRERVVVLGIYDPKNAKIPLEIKLPTPMKKTDCSLDTILEKNNNDPQYKLTNAEIKVIDTWNEFYRGIKEKVIGFPIWTDWFKLPPPTDEDMPEWKRVFIKKNNTLYNNNKDFIDAWLKRHNYLKGFTPTMRKMEWQCGEAVSSAWNAFLQMRPSGLRIKRPDCAPALVAIVQVPIIGKYKRRMTLREAARLQSFDDKFIPNSNMHQAYKQFGNAVNVEVIRICSESLFRLGNQPIFFK